MEGTIKLNLSKKYFLLVVMLTITIVHAFGEPTKDADGYYKLSTKEDMVWLKDNAAKGYMCKLINDIDLGTWDGIGSESEPFNGIFDGKGFSIKNMLQENHNDYIGLFNNVQDATIKNFTINGQINVDNNSDITIGAVAAQALDNTIITNITCHVSISANQLTSNSNVGGIIGSMDYNIIDRPLVDNCIYDGNIIINTTNDITCGGICANVMGGNVCNCTCSSSIIVHFPNNNNGYVGGICGIVGPWDTEITRNNFYGKIDFGSYISKNTGLIVGFYEVHIISESIFGGNNYITSNNVSKELGVADIEGTLKGINNGEYSIITNVEEFNTFAENVNSSSDYVNGLVLNNIDFTGKTIKRVGTNSNPFKGIFEGGNYLIKNINIESTDPVVGLFNYVDGATIKNFAVNGNIKTDAGVNDAYCGLIAKANGTTNISQIICEVNYDCKAQQGKQCYLGSIVAHSNGDTNINNSLSTGELKGWAEWGQKPNVGGFVALNNGSITIKNCYSCNSFNVDRWNSYYFAFAPNTNATFSNCYQYNITDLFNNPSNYSKVEKSDVKSGVLCAKLNNGQATPVWGQVVGNDLTGEYDYPRPESKNIITKDSEGYYHAGMIKLIMNENELVIPDNKDIVSDNMQLTTQLTDTYWHPIYLPIRLTYESWKDKFDVAKIMNFHDYEVDDVRYVVLEVEKVNQGTLRENHPYIIRAKEASSEPQVLTLSSSVFTDDQCRTLYKLDDTKTIDCATTETKYTFKGTYSTKTDFADSDYILTNGYLNKDAMSADGTKVVYPGGWYMTTTSRISSSSSSSSSARRIAIRFSGFDEYEVANELTELETGIEVPAESKTEAYPVAYFANNGMKINTPQKGLNIVKMSDGSVKKLWVK